MVTLQELITRGRFVMCEAPSRVKVFEAVDGRSTARDIAVATGRHVNNVRRDLTVLRDAGLIQQRAENGAAVMRDGLPVYEKVPLARTISATYFKPTAKRPETAGPIERTPRQRRGSTEMAVPDETEILTIARNGEDQQYEFKTQGTDITKVVREIGAMLNTSQGGMILYGIDDDGTIVGADTSRQELDQRLQNSLRNMIAPAAIVRLHAVSVLGNEVLVIIVPPWKRTDVYQYGERILLRKGTNVLAARPEEVRRLHRGEAIL